MSQPRIMIAAAGTGGHVFPALAVAEALRDLGWQVDWLGTSEQRIEAKVVPAHGFALYQLAVRGVRGHGVVRKLKAPWQIFKAILQARKIIRQQESQLVMTFGGYVSGPAGLAAKSLGLPLLVHEQNAIPGMTTKLLSRWADEVMLGFAQAQSYLPKALVTGNPLRAMPKREPQPAQQSLHVLVVGGSLGAQALNEWVPKALEEILTRHPELNLVVTHQAGADKAESTQEHYRATPLPTVSVVEFIDDMAAAYQRADLVICRAGALTVAELAAVGVASVLVPLPHAVDDHQTANAKSLADNDAAILVPQRKLMENGVNELASLLTQPARLERMSGAAAAAHYPAATQALVERCRYWLEHATTKDKS